MNASPATAPGNDRLLRAMCREPVDRTPIWLMRQAGRYLPEYRRLRERAGSFMAMCQDPDLACEITLQPLERFALDGAIIFSDILTIPDAMGRGLYFIEGEGPKLERPVRGEDDILALEPPPMERLAYVFDAIATTRRALTGRVPLLGFSGSPWTLATYMVEGGASRDFARTKALLYERPDLAHRLLGVLTEAVTAYLNAQIAAGAQAVQIFDTWGGALTTPAFERFSLACLRRIVAGLTREHEGRRVPVILFTKGGGLWLEGLADTGCDVLALDWTIELGAARQRVGKRVALQGNLDPALLKSSPRAIREEAVRILHSYGKGSGHVFNLGHGITPDVPPEHVAALVDAVQDESPALHQP